MFTKWFESVPNYVAHYENWWISFFVCVYSMPQFYSEKNHIIFDEFVLGSIDPQTSVIVGERFILYMIIER